MATASIASSLSPTLRPIARWWTASYSAPVRCETRRITSSVSARGSLPRGIRAPAKRIQRRNTLRLRATVVNRFSGLVVPAALAAIRPQRSRAGRSPAGRAVIRFSAAQPLEQVDERLVGLARSPAQADLAGPVGADVGVAVGGRDLGRLARGRRRGQLRVQEAAVAGEAAAGRRRRERRPPRRAPRRAARASPSRPRWRRRAGRVDDRGPTRSPISRPGEQVARPRRSSRGSSISRGARRSPRSAARRLEQAVGAGGRVDHDRQPAPVRPAPELLDRLRSPSTRRRRDSPSSPTGSPQQLPATSAGIQTGLPARSETATSAAGSDSGAESPSCASSPGRGRRSG